MPPQSPPSRIEDKVVPLSMWIGGMNSLPHPASLREGQYYFGENIINRGGILQTRPGYAYRAGIQGIRLQGMVTYRPKKGAPVMLVAVDGEIYRSIYPFFEFSKLPNLAFSPTAEIVNFCVCIRASKRNQDDSIALITPTTVVIIQDGVSRAGCYDGTDDRHLNPENPFNETPTMLWMAWSGARLWGSDGSRVYASDLADPYTFKETDYLAQRSAFELPDTCTGMIDTASGAGLLVFTENSTILFKSFITDRTQWQLVDEFQKTIIPAVGCVAGRSAVNQYGVTHWYSKAGFISLDAALNSQRSSEVITIDGQMQRSKSRISADRSRICAGSFENLMLVSVPSGGRYNEHTWVMDQTPLDGDQGAPRAWAGIWTGARPVAWSSIALNGRDRCYFASYDKSAMDGTRIHIWEAFNIRKLDADNRIDGQFETAMISFPDKHRFRYAELDLCEIVGAVEFRVYIGGISGEWHEVLDTVIQSNSGVIGSPELETITVNSVMRSYKPQTRTVRTKEFSANATGCDAESHNQPGTGKYFQILVEWKGRCGVSAIRSTFAPLSEQKIGRCHESEEDDTRSVTEQGVTVTNE